MANNVFSDPIIDAALEGVRMDANNKEADARAYLENLQSETGQPFTSCARVMVYNGTGNTLHFVLSQEWRGHVGTGGYPDQIPNGEWGAFILVNSENFGCSESSGAVVYRNKTHHADCMLAYSTRWISAPPSPSQLDNHVYTEIQEQGYYDHVDWKEIEDKLAKSGVLSEAIGHECVSGIMVDGNPTNFKASLAAVPAPAPAP